MFWLGLERPAGCLETGRSHGAISYTKGTDGKVSEEFLKGGEIEPSEMERRGPGPGVTRGGFPYHVISSLFVCSPLSRTCPGRHTAEA